MAATYARDMRLIQAAVEAIDKAQLTESIRHVLGKFRVESIQLQLRKLPVIHVSNEVVYGREHPISVVSGEASIYTHSCTVFAPGLARRRSHGFGLNLSVLEVVVHEVTHRISGERVAKGTHIDGGAQYKTTRYHNGLRESLIVDGMEAIENNIMLNEGVTQYFALEVMREYLRRGWYMQVSKPEVGMYFEQVERGVRGAFYPAAVTYVEALAKRLAQPLGSREKAYHRLLRAYFRAEPILHDKEWRELLVASGVYGILKRARGARHRDLAGFTTQIASGMIDRGVWESIETEEVPV